MVYEGEVLGSKRTGSQGAALSKILEVDTSDMVLIDDQPFKNAREVIEAGYRAIISPPPVGDVNNSGTVIEHPGVMRFRRLERRILASRAARDSFGNIVFSRAGYGDVRVIRH